ncbi:MAG: formate dehydrogenase subunit alpha [Thermodesulfovibrionales bacterium]
MITITINGKRISLEKPTTVLEAAKANGISIPHFCHHPLLEQYGGCRMCLVEVEKMPKLQTSCTLTVTDGMVIRTESPEISKARKAVLEFLLINHALECPVCDKAGECKLQDYTMRYGPTAGRFEEGKRKHPESLDDPVIVRNMERCILCTRCVRMCDGVQGASAISITGRGNHSFMEPFSGGRYDCEYCGNCLTVCPVGAIMSRLHRYRYRPWQMDAEVKTVCSYCGVGCSMIAEVRENSIMRTVPRIGLGHNNGILCNRGRFGYGYVKSGERLTTPLIRKNGSLEPSSWDEALSTVAQKLKDIKERHGGEAIAGVASARCANEDNYMFQRLMRAGLGTNNIDSIARLGFAGAQRLLEGMLGQGVTANIISGIPQADAILVMGGDPTRINPVMGIQIRNAYRRGTSTITIGNAPGLKWHTTLGLSPLPLTEEALLGGVLSEVLSGKALPGDDPELEKAIKELDLPSPEEAARLSGVPREQIAQAAQALKEASSSCMVLGRDAVSGGNLLLVGSLAYAVNARIYLMSERPNEQGLMDMGCLPDMLPGERPVALANFRKRCEDVWGAKVPEKEGLTLMEFFEAAASGSLKAMYVMGENPAFNLPDSGFVRQALSRLEFLVVQDIFLTETAEMAHVVLPATSWSEKDGTFVNLERRIQRLGRAVSGPEKCMDDWKILAEVGKKMGLDMSFGDAASVMAEISRVSPLYAGLTYEDIDAGANLWPYKGEPLRHPVGADIAQFRAYKKPSARAERPLHIAIEKPLFHSGTLSRGSSSLNSLYPEPVVRLGRETAGRHSLAEGDRVEITTDKGALTLSVTIDETAPESVLYLTNNFRDKGAYALVGYSLDPVTKAPVPDGGGVSMKKVGA